MGPNEPYWRTNTSFSPPLSRRWDRRFQPEVLPYGSHGGTQLYESSPSSNSKDSRSWFRGDPFPNNQHSVSDGIVSYFSSPSDSFKTQQFTPPPMQGVDINDYVSATMREPASGPSASIRSTEGTSAIPYSGGSASSHSDASEDEPMSKTHFPSHRNFSSRYSFMSKPVHPISFSNQTPEEEAHNNRPKPNENSILHSDTKSTELHSISGFTDLSATPRREGFRGSSSSSVDFTDVSEHFTPESLGFSNNPSEGTKCGLCERFLSHRSPWSSRRIVRSGDMPITGVLSCRHVYHAECLDQITPKTQKHDPPCPLCTKSEDENFPEQRLVCRQNNGIQRLRSFGEDGPSRPWGCGQVGDCVEGALHAQTRSTTLLLNRNRLKKHMFMKRSSGKELPDKLKKSGSYSPQLLHGRASVDRAIQS
ncbi:RING/U-box superfamily protein [Tasmannia lanceolata]|uniref:RING/U-box superfamily protein n=1 Tax=Tasmannia lanceolata TaxID=3420 RepID=UPI0040638D79